MSDRPKRGEALAQALDANDRRRTAYTNARANQKAQAALEADEAARDLELQRRLKAETRARRPEWFA